jgi:hypothetical protein
MHVPTWLSLLVAVWVIVFGLYRLKLAFDRRVDDRRAAGVKGIFVMKRRTQGLLGFIYVLLGAALVATTFGWSPLAGVLQSDEQSAPSAPKKPSTAIPIQR